MGWPWGKLCFLGHPIVLRMAMAVGSHLNTMHVLAMSAGQELLLLVPHAKAFL